MLEFPAEPIGFRFVVAASGSFSIAFLRPNPGRFPLIVG